MADENLNEVFETKLDLADEGDEIQEHVEEDEEDEEEEDPHELVRLVIHQETIQQIPDSLLEYLMVVMVVLDYNMISKELIHIMLVVRGGAVFIIIITMDIKVLVVLVVVEMQVSHIMLELAV